MRAAQEMKSLVLLGLFLASCSNPKPPESPIITPTLPPSGEIFPDTLKTPLALQVPTVPIQEDTDAETKFQWMQERKNPFEGERKNYPADNMIVQPNTSEHDSELGTTISNQTQNLVFRFNRKALQHFSARNILGAPPDELSFAFDKETIITINQKQRTAAIRMQNFSDDYELTKQILTVWMQLNNPTVDEQTLTQEAEALAAISCRPSGEWFNQSYERYAQRVKNPVSKAEFGYLFKDFMTDYKSDLKTMTSVPPLVSANTQ